MKKIAIIGASYLQEPLIEKAKIMGIETHVFAWKCGDVGEKTADYFYPISIIEKDIILKKCIEIQIDGICSIASDLAVITVNYVAAAMGLIGNSPECTLLSTNKHSMREAFLKNMIPSPKSYLISSVKDIENSSIEFPVIVKPVDRSVSRGITKVINFAMLEHAIELAKSVGFIKKALVEEYVDGQEYSVECVSWQGSHHFLAITQKYTTGAPQFIETGHIEPVSVDDKMLIKIKNVVFHALNSLKIEYGASHSELKITNDGKIVFIEIGGRMGGDFIGSDLVDISTGIDFVGAVLQIALGEQPDLTVKHELYAAAIRYIVSDDDVKILDEVRNKHPEYLVRAVYNAEKKGTVTDSSNRWGYFILMADSPQELISYMPES